MALKFDLQLTADTAEELRDGVRQLAGMFGDGEDNEATETGAPTSRRGRPRRTQIDAAPGTAASGGPTVTQESSVGAAAGLIATTAASPSEITKETVTAAMQKAMTVAAPLAIQEALVAKGLGKRLSEITPEQYPAALAVFEAITAGGADLAS